jgi:uncharacterized protein (TIGR03435 family)
MAFPLRAVLFLLLAVAVFAQEQDHAAAPVRAGDPAPQIDWTRVVRSPASAKYSPTLTGQYTVLLFLPVTPNTQAVGRWNDLIAKFSDQPVQFVWIATEPWSAVEPFLKDHSIDGWLLIDEKRELARAYEGDSGEDVIIDPSGRVAGFARFLQAEQLTAILAGNGIAIPRDTPADQVFKLLANGKVRLEREPQRFDAPPVSEKPRIPPSYEVHITPSTTNGIDASSGPDFWVQRGFDLKTILSTVYEKEPSRVVLPQSLDDDEKFDFVLVLPKEEDQKTVYQLVQHAIEKHFKVSAAVESKPAEVYVMTAIKGKTPPAKNDSGGLGSDSSSSGFEFSLPPGTPQTPEAIDRAMKELLKNPETAGFSEVSAGNMTADEFGTFLENGFGRPIVNETGLEGRYDFEVHGPAKNTGEFLQNLRDQIGIVLTPATRNIEFVTLRSL